MKLYIRFDYVREFEHKYVIAHFLHFHQEVKFVRYIKDYYFLAKTELDGTDKEVVVSLFSSRELSPEQKGNNKIKDNLELVSYKRRMIHGKKTISYDRKVKPDFEKLYSEYLANPFKHISKHILSDEYTYLTNLVKEYNSKFKEEVNDNLLYKYKALPNPDLKEDKLNENKGYIKAFVNGEVAFMDPNSFNDPFDSDCDVPVLLLRDFYEKYKRDFEKDDKEAPSFDDVLERYKLLSQNDRGEKGDYSTPSEILQKIFKDVFSEKREFPMDYVNTYLNIKDRFRILCLTPKFDDILMWGYYGDSGKGVCGGFSFSSIRDGVEKRNEHKAFILIYGDLQYRDDIHKLQYSGQDLFSFIVDCVFTKYVIWKHESEKRFLLIEEDFENWIIPINADCKKYYLGVTTNVDEWKREYDSSNKLHKLKKHKSEYRLIE